VYAVRRKTAPASPTAPAVNCTKDHRTGLPAVLVYRLGLVRASWVD